MLSHIKSFYIITHSNTHIPTSQITIPNLQARSPALLLLLLLLNRMINIICHRLIHYLRKDLKLSTQYKFYSLKDTGITNMLRHL